jgi:hypothetical protein
VLALLALLLTADPLPERHYLQTREGKQCSLRAATAIAVERERLGPAALDVYVSYALKSELLPAACIPKDLSRFVKKKQLPVCEACGCPETWFYCLRSAAAPKELRKLGYTPVD